VPAKATWGRRGFQLNVDAYHEHPLDCSHM
jgi:hypothetical protein